MSQRDGQFSTAVMHRMLRLDQLNNEVRAAMDANDSATTAQKCLEFVLLSPSVWFETRYSLFRIYSSTVLQEGFEPSENDIDTLTTKFLDNEEEPMLYRSMVAYILGKWKLRDGSKNEDEKLVAVEYLQTAVRLCDSASRSERNRRIQMPNVQDGTTQIRVVGSELDDLKKSFEFELQYQADPYGFMLQTFQETHGANDRAFAEEFIQSFLRHADHPEAMFPRPPAVTSTIIERVKSLPQQDISILIYEDKTNLDKRKASNEDVNAAIRGNHVYKVFQVDLSRWRAGRTTKVFEQMKVFFCNPTQPRASCLVATFAGACLEPFVLLPTTTQTHPSFRPNTVFFETDEDANHPMVQSFLSMMGCSDIRVIDDGAKHLLEITMPDVLKTSEKLVFSKEAFPHIYDFNKGRVCGNCGITGRGTLLACSCGGAYYCSKQCQTEKWKDHKIDHKEFLSQKKVKEERRASRNDNNDMNK